MQIYLYIFNEVRIGYIYNGNMKIAFFYFIIIFYDYAELGAKFGK